MPRRAQAFFALATLAAGALAIHPLACSRSTDCPSDAAPSLESTCPDRSEESSTPADFPALLVEYGGCTDVMGTLGGDEVECIYQPNKTELKLWVTHPRASEAEIFVDDRPVSPERHSLPHEPGQGFRFPLEDGARTVVVVVPQAEPWSLRLRDAPSLDPHLEDQRKVIEHRARKLQERLRDQRDEHALVELDRLIRYTLSKGLLSFALQIAVGTSYFTHSRLEKLAAAQQVFESLSRTAQRYPEGRAMLSIYLSRVLRLRGRQIDAAMAARSGSQTVMRIRNPQLLMDGLNEYSRVLANLGYFEAAAHWRSYALELGRNKVTREVSTLLEVTGSVNLLLKKAGQPHQDPRHHYDELRTRSGPDGARPSASVLAIAQLGLAEVAMLDDDPTRALAHLHAIDYEQLPERRHVTARDLELQAHLALGSARAVIESRLRSLEQMASRTLELNERWSAAVRRGQALEALGKPDDARRAYEASEALLDTLLPLAALGIGGQALVARHDEGTERLMSSLLRAPEPRAADALCVARRAQARLGRLSVLMNGLDAKTSQPALSRQIETYLRAKRDYEELLRRAATLPGDRLERANKAARQRQRDIQRLALTMLSRQHEHEVRPPCEQLRARDPGELLLGLFPVGDDLVVFASDDEGVTHHVLPRSRAMSLPGPDTILAQSLLGPVEDRIRRASSIRVLAGGDARTIPVHALPFERGSPLGLERPVVYGLELPVRPASRLRTIPARALVLGDERALGALEAVDTAADALWARDYHVESFTTAQGRGPEIRTQLPTIDHFFYAGHAYFTTDREPDDAQGLWPPYPGGAALEPSYLRLDEVAKLEVAEIPMLDPVPAVTVLMGCATGVDDPRTHTGGQSLATAFIAAGSSVVIASTRTVDAEQAFLLSEGLYHHLATLDVEGPGRWMQAAMQWAQDDERWQTVSFADYRVLVP